MPPRSAVSYKTMKVSYAELPAYAIAYMSIYDSFQLYHYVLSKLKLGVHKRVPSNEKKTIYVISAEQDYQL